MQSKISSSQGLRCSGSSPGLEARVSNLNFRSEKCIFELGFERALDIESLLYAVACVSFQDSCSTHPIVSTWLVEVQMFIETPHTLSMDLALLIDASVVPLPPLSLFSSFSLVFHAYSLDTIAAA